MTDDTPAPRLAPLPRADWDDTAIDALRRAYPESVVDRFLSTDPDAPPVPTAIGTLLHHPALAGAWLTYNNVLLQTPALDARARELMVLRVAWRTRSTYEWVQHVKYSERYGVTPADVEAVATGDGRDAWTALERDLVAATDQLVDGYRVDDATWERLGAELDERQLVELVFVVGTYACLAMAFKTFGLQLEAGTDTSGMPLPPA